MENNLTLSLDKIQVSTNPRKTFDEQKLKELTESVKADGVLQPILVRPFNGGYQLVSGERRFRAAKAAKLPEIPVVVREFSDLKVLEIQLTENLQRDDLNPLEEADGYRELCEKHDYQIDDLAAKLHKSRSYVYGRLKLANLPKSVKSALLEGLSPSTALLIARIPDPELRKQAAEEVLNDEEWYGGERVKVIMSFRRAKRFIQENYMVRLKGCPFSTTDDSLLPDVGSCTTCPHRSGNLQEVFPDIGSTDVCTNPKCFEEKKEAAWVKASTKAKARDQKVLSKKESESAFPYGGSLTYNSRYVDLKEKNYDDPKNQRWKKLLGKDCPQITVARDRNGDVHELVVEKEAQAILAKKHKWAANSRKDRHAAENKRHRTEARISGETNRRLTAQALEQVEKLKVSREVWELIALGVVFRAWSDTLREVAKRREIEPKKAQWGGRDYTTSFQEAISKMSISELIGLTFEISVMPAFLENDVVTKKMSSLLTLNPKATEKEVRKEFREKKKKAKKGGKKQCS